MEKKIINKKAKGMNRHWKNFLDKDYLGSHNLEEGEEMLLTITKFVGEEKVKTADGDKVKIVLYFAENVPKMILNITNGTTLANLYGLHPDNWIGKKILVFATPVKAFGKVQDALRIRDFRPENEGDVSEWTSQLEKATNLVELAFVWKSFKLSVQKNKKVEAFKDLL